MLKQTNHTPSAKNSTDLLKTVFSNGSACLWLLSLLQCPGAAEASNIWVEEILWFPSLFPPGMEGFVEGKLVAKGKLHPQDVFFGRQSPGLKWSLL